MSIQDEHRQFLAEQGLRFGEPILVSALGRVLASPIPGPEMVFLLVGESGLHLLAPARDRSVFGLSFPGKGVPKEPEPTSYPRERIAGFSIPRRQGWWAFLTTPPQVVEFQVTGGTKNALWRIQLVGGADEFVQAWTRAWAGSLSD